MKHSKDYYRKSAPAGWQWVGTGDYPFTHIYSSGDYKTGFKELNCTEDCITNGNLEFMAKHGLTMTTALLKKESRRIVKRENMFNDNVKRGYENLEKNLLTS